MGIPENVVIIDESAVPSKCGWERRVLAAPGLVAGQHPRGDN
jgi:hypothetical protein